MFIGRISWDWIGKLTSASALGFGILAEWSMNFPEPLWEHEYSERSA
jgi:hypothetical protein